MVNLVDKYFMFTKKFNFFVFSQKFWQLFFTTAVTKNGKSDTIRLVLNCKSADTMFSGTGFFYDPQCSG